MTPQYEQTRNRYLTDPSTPTWMKALIREAERHDLCDAVAVLDTVTQLVTARLDEYQR